MLLGKERYLESELQAVHFENVFYEETLENDGQQLLSFSSRDFQTTTDFGGTQSRKQIQRKKYISSKQRGNNSEHLYLVDGDWVKRWTQFLRNGSAPSPGIINNDALYLQISQGEKVIIGDEVFAISESVWNMLYQWYGGGPTLKWKIPIESEILLFQGREDLRNSSKAQENLKIRNNKALPMNQRNYQKKSQAPKHYDASDFIISNVQRNSPLTPFMDSKIVSPVSTPFPLDTLKQKQPNLFGLENNSYYCYLNAVLQCLFNIPDFRHYFRDGEFLSVSVREPVSKDRSYKYSRLMAEMVEEVMGGNKTVAKVGQVRVLKTTKLRKLVQSEFNPIMEHDAHEFMLYLVNRLKEEVTEKEAKVPSIQSSSFQISTYLKTFPSLVDDLFTIVEQTLISCTACGSSASTLQFHLTLPLSLSTPNTSLAASLATFTRPEPLSDYSCDSCHLRSHCLLSRHLLHTPRYLTINLSRFTSSLRKLRTHVAFPEELLDISGQGDVVYDLVAVAVHLGELRSGHYVAYTKKEDGMWYLMDDTRVSRVSKAEVLQQEAYILTYQKRQEQEVVSRK